MSEAIYLFGDCEQTPCSGCGAAIAGYTLVGEFDIDSVTCMETTCPRQMDWTNTPGNTLVSAGTYESGVGTSEYLLRYKSGFMQRCVNDGYYYQAIYKEFTHETPCEIPAGGPSKTGWWVKTHINDSDTVTWKDVWANVCGRIEFKHHNNRDLVLWWVGGLGFGSADSDCTSRVMDIGDSGRAWEKILLGYAKGSGNWTCCLYRKD